MLVNIYVSKCKKKYLFIYFSIFRILRLNNICLRFSENLLSYTTARGDSGLEDNSYDGTLDGGLMKGGLGQLVDGLFGPNDFILETRDNPENREGNGAKSE